MTCKNEELAYSLGLTDSGELLTAKGSNPIDCGLVGGNSANSGQTVYEPPVCERWEPIDFNKLYAGYYPACSFTAIACCGGMFYAAAIAEDGLPCVFASLMGGVWEPVNLLPVSADGVNSRPSGKVLRILYDAADNQVFLICQNGELVTLPDCPRCVKVKRVTTKEVVDGWLDNDSKEIVMLCGDGTECRIPLREAVQYRAAVDYIKQQLVNGGYLVDVRGHDMYGSESVENSVCVPLEDLPDWLEELPCSTVLAFFCQIGTRSDKAAEYARRKGFTRAFSLGGLRDAASVLVQQPL